MNQGRIEIILGCMFSGKSTEIIRRKRQLNSINKKVMVIKHSSDKRYHTDDVISHDQMSMNCFSLTNLMIIHSIQNLKKIFSNSEFIIIEEAQFFPDLFEFVTQAADEYNKCVIVAGLDGDFQRNPFGNSDLLRLIPHAEEVIKLKGYCQLCNDLTPASFTRRIINSTEQHLVGGKESYIPVCRKHHIFDIK